MLLNGTYEIGYWEIKNSKVFKLINSFTLFYTMFTLVTANTFKMFIK